MNHRLPTLAARAALLCTALMPLAQACAESRVTRGAGTIGVFIGEDGFVQNQVSGSSIFPDPLTMHSYLICVASSPGEVTCSYDPTEVPAPTHWYQRENVPTSAAAQAQADWGIARVRTFSGGAQSGNIQLPTGTSRQYSAGATAEWQESLTYVAAAPGLVTFEVRLHATWNDFGRMAAYGGVPHYEADAADWIDGQVYDNCVLSASFSTCAPRFEGEYGFIAGSDPDNRAGSVDRLLRFSAIIRPSSDPRDDEDPTPVGPTDFLIGLSASSGYDDAEMDAFSTLTLERVILQPGATLSFGSGTQYLVTTVPEPGTLALWSSGLALLAGLAARRRTRGAA